MNKSDIFDSKLKELSRLSKVVSHPARLSILQFLAETKSCITGDISDFLPLSRTTVSQHLKELKKAGFIHGEIDGLKVNYCICHDELARFTQLHHDFFQQLLSTEIHCTTK